MTTAAQTATPATETGFLRLLTHALAGGAIAAVVNLVLFFGTRAAGVVFTGEFQPGATSELPVPAIAISSIVPGVVAALVALAFRKFTAAPARNFAILAGVFTVLSFGGPPNVAHLGTAAIVVMELMHVVAAVGIAGALVKALRS